jgi:hypothetical protein
VKTIIAGSKTIQSYQTVLAAIVGSGFTPTEVFTSMDSGPSVFGFRWATENKIPVRRFKADWSALGKMAGMVMNAEMCTFADALIVIWDNRDWQTNHIIQYSTKMDPPLRRHIVNVGPQEQTLTDYGRIQSNANP